MQTSYFAKYKGTNAISIAGKSPTWYVGKEYKLLAPKYWFFKKYKEDHDKEFYIKHFYLEVLNPLDPQKVYDDLGENAVLLCYEKPGDFCHRFIVAEWLYYNLDIKIPEFGYNITTEPEHNELIELE
jgi:hypothetical protein